MAMKHVFSDEYPLVISVFSGYVSFEDSVAFFSMLDDYMHDNSLSMLYWIVDVCDVDFSYSTIASVAELIEAKTPGTVGDSRVIPLAVMPLHAYEYYIGELQNRYFWMEFPVFDSVYSAYMFMYQLLQSPAK